MKCLTVRQPWASLVVGGATRYLVRDWRTLHRGPLAIQASGSFPAEHLQLCNDPLMRQLLLRHGYAYAADLPRQAVLGTVTVADCFRLTEETLAGLDPEDPAVVFGQAQPGCWAWVCAEARALAHPVALPGRLGVYTIPDSVVHA